jgi:hypothetical protein
LVNEAHVWSYPLTAALDHFIHGVEIHVSVLVQSIGNDERCGTTGTELTVNEDLLSASDAVVDELTKREQVVEDFRVVVPTHMKILGLLCGS